ncbi:hypothetical protein [Acinetobacter bereziniae]|uniref:hypothetical protein n=1 Tax=Acinetobacter bereziniae TaxID=106648 RepID=UPI00125ECF8D|nr:hypothetical protein [Acinetobacter bereziniae]
MSRLGDYLESCFVDGHIDLRKVMERCSVSFDNLSLDDVRFVESECRELRQKFEDAEKVECYKTYGLQSIGFSDTAYFSLDEIDLVKGLVGKQADKGNFEFEVKKLKISKDVLTGHIRDRKEWEK